jgi:hypothetical protein
MMKVSGIILCRGVHSPWILTWYQNGRPRYQDFETLTRAKKHRKMLRKKETQNES